ncbi:MAG: hypothetical protein M3315_03605 [Actinomycetota bacterium]|nr:hypothetical protein [Actinomycetota bacterium]MDQ3921513.1 hypothetical protein [Actinomycetota bacterium]
MTSREQLRSELLEHLERVEEQIQEVLEGGAEDGFLGDSGRVYTLSILTAEARRVRAHLAQLEAQDEGVA